MAAHGSTETMGTIFWHFMVQLTATAGVFCACGLVLWLLNRLFFFLVGRKGRAVCIATGLIGTPIHELGHAFFCLIFFHKIKEIKLFQPNSQDGTLGYVSHSYNPKNIYQQIGNFFIGIGPILFGTGILVLLMRFCIPGVFFGFITQVGSASTSNLFPTVLSGMTVLFNPVNFQNGLFWVFFIVAILITLHMSLSMADVKGSVVGFLFLAVFMLLVNIGLYFLPTIQSAVTVTCIRIGIFSIYFFSIAIAVSLALNLIALLVKLIKKIFIH